MDIVFLKQAKKELQQVPEPILLDIVSLLDELSAGRMLGLPISRPLPSIAKGLHELRLTGRSGIYRLFYVIRIGDAIYVLHVANKKTQKLSHQTAAIIKARLKDIES